MHALLPPCRMALRLLCFALILRASPCFATDNALYANLLTQYTQKVADTAGTRVDYDGLRTSKDWQQLIQSVAQTDIDRLATGAERLAFWINVYNIFTIDILVRNEPVDSIRDLGSIFEPVWMETAGRVGKRFISLDEIEHQILRPMGEPRIHAAIVCGSTSCPSLLREPWVAERIDEQLDAAMGRWLAENRKGLRIDREAGVIYLSRIFRWFEDDFRKAGGVIDFIRPHISGLDRVWLSVNESNATVRYFEYDWSLNSTPSYPASPE